MPQRAPRCRLRAWAAVLGLALATQAVAQNPPAPAPQPPAIVTGVFVDSAGAPIRHAVLSVVGESLRVVADSQGRFRLLVPPGPRLLAARALGYRPLMWTIGLEPGQQVTQRVRLQELSVVLPGITVTAQAYVPSRLAGFYQRRRTGFGKYLDSAAIAGRFTNSVADLLQGIAGVRVRAASGDPFGYVVTFSRCQALPQIAPPVAADPFHPKHGGQTTSPASTTGTDVGRNPVGVYVDGFRVPGDPGEILGMINPADVEAIEIYRGPSELPAEIMSDDCAAIVIWTKY